MSLFATGGFLGANDVLEGCHRHFDTKQPNRHCRPHEVGVAARAVGNEGDIEWPASGDEVEEFVDCREGRSIQPNGQAVRFCRPDPESCVDHVTQAARRSRFARSHAGTMSASRVRATGAPCS